MLRSPAEKISIDQHTCFPLRINSRFQTIFACRRKSRTLADSLLPPYVIMNKELSRTADPGHPKRLESLLAGCTAGRPKLDTMET